MKHKLFHMLFVLTLIFGLAMVAGVSAVTPAQAAGEVVISNLPIFDTYGNGFLFGEAFTMGATDITITQVRIRLAGPCATPPPVTLRADSSGVPGTTLVNFSSPTSVPNKQGTYVFTTSSFTLNASTTYWLVVDSPSSGGCYWSGDDSTVPTGLYATFIGGAYFDGSVWNSYSPTVGFEIGGSSSGSCSSSVNVTNNTDNGAGSLRQALADVCPDGAITFDSSLSGVIINLASTLSIYDGVTIDGSSLASQITISGDTDNNGTGDVRIFQVNSGIIVTLNSLTITKGFVNTSTTSAGAIDNHGNLTILNSTLSDNHAYAGGAIYNYGSLTITNSTFINNQAVSNSGGAVSNQGTLTITNSTFSGNSSLNQGGAIFSSSGILTIRNSTFNGNLNSYGNGSAIYADTMMGGPLNMYNTLIASSSGVACDAGFSGPATNIYNFVQDGSCSASLSGDPKLDVLANNGGPTQTFALLVGSPAIDAGNPAGCTDQDGNLLTTDQRGVARVGICDIGAYEIPTAGVLVTGGNHQSVTTTFAFPQPLQVAVFDNQGSPASGVTVTFTAPASGPSGIFADTGTNTTLVDTDTNGVATTSIFTANDQAGTYTVSASASGFGSVNFNMEQFIRPTNDNFTNAATIDTLPFSDIVDNTFATVETDESQYCDYSPRTVWYKFAPTVNTEIRINTEGSSFSDNVITAYQDTGNGLGGLNVFSCVSWGGSLTFTAQAGATYYFQVGSINSSGELHLNLQEIPRPANDDFNSSKPISALPFSDTVDITNATTEPGEPQPCYYSPKTVWYSFTPAANALVKADMLGSSFSDTVFNVYQAVGSGFNGLSFMQCAYFGNSATFNVQAGIKYYIQAGSIYGSGGNLQLNLQEIPRPANDDFANAIVASSPLPFDSTVDTQNSSRQTGEPTPSCSYYGPGTRSVWYAFTPANSGSYSVSIFGYAFTPVFAAYTGSSLGNLTQIGCQTYTGNLMTLHMNAGTKYYFQVGNLYPWEQGGPVQFHLDIAPQPVASFYYYPGDPSKYDTIQFYDGSNDPGNVGFQTFGWTFGDGGTSSISSPTHKYTADGSYQVTHKVTTVDGRTATIIQTVQVRTHDVAITKLTTPNSANSGQNKTITVTLRNIAYPETVQIDLYKSTANGFVWVATVTKSVPVLSGNKTIAVDFSYTFTSDDAKLGKVTFKAVATIVGARDAYPSDNEAISSIIKVAK